MNALRDVTRYALVRNKEYPDNVESVLDGSMQARFARKKKRGELVGPVFHPDYHFPNVRRTEDAVRGAFTLRIIGVEGKSLEDLEYQSRSTDEVPNLEHIGGDGVTYRILNILNATNFLRINKVVSVQDGVVIPRNESIAILDANPVQAYTVLPTELHSPSGIDIGGEYDYRSHKPDVAEIVYQQYSPYYSYIWDSNL